MAVRKIVDGDIMLATLACFNTNQVGLNNTHWLALSHTGVGADDEDLALYLDTTLAPMYKLYLGAQASWYGVRVQKQLPLPKPVAAISAGFIGPGTGSAATLPGQAAAVMTKRTLLAGRAYRGRIYLPFAAQAMNNATTNKPEPAAMALFNAIGTALAGNITVGTVPNQTVLQPVLFHRRTGTTTPLQEMTAAGAWGTQKRRGNYGRPNVYPPFVE